MANPYIGVSILGCDSPAINADKDTYSGKFDTAQAALDQHDHTTGRGVPISTAAIADAAVTRAKLAFAAPVVSTAFDFTSSGTGGTDDADGSTSELIKAQAITVVSGGPVTVRVIQDSADPSAGSVAFLKSSGSPSTYSLFLFRGATLVARYLFVFSDGDFGGSMPCSTINFIDPAPSVGAHTYSLKGGVANNLDVISFKGKLFLQET